MWVTEDRGEERERGAKWKTEQGLKNLSISGSHCGKFTVHNQCFPVEVFPTQNLGPIFRQLVR